MWREREYHERLRPSISCIISRWLSVVWKGQSERQHRGSDIWNTKLDWKVLPVPGGQLGFQTSKRYHMNINKYATVIIIIKVAMYYKNTGHCSFGQCACSRVTRCPAKEPSSQRTWELFEMFWIGPTAETINPLQWRGSNCARSDYWLATRTAFPFWVSNDKPD